MKERVMAFGLRATVIATLASLIIGTAWAFQTADGTATSPARHAKTGLFSHETPPVVGPANGTLVIGGGGPLDEAIWERFIELAGGPDAEIVVVPTASGAAERADFSEWPTFKCLRSAGARNLSIVHTRDRQIADTDEFVAPLNKAKGVWITGGNQWRLVTAYLGTQTQKALFNVLERGGVIGGSSAGATIQGVFASFPGRGTTPYEPGFGFLRKVAIDQHLLARHRENDLLQVVRDHPEVIGIGIDEGTAVVVQDDCMDVLGDSKVAIYDPELVDSQDEHPYYFLSPGDRFNLRTRSTDEVVQRVGD
jgi:cyanophycinase